MDTLPLRIFIDVMVFLVHDIWREHDQRKMYIGDIFSCFLLMHDMY